MKRLILAFGLICILISYSLLTEKFILSFCDNINDTLQICADLIAEEKYSQAEHAVSMLYNIWEEKDDIMSAFIGDDSVVEPRKSIVSILLSLKDGNYDECLINIRECQGYIHDISENNSTNLSNIL